MHLSDGRCFSMSISALVSNYVFVCKIRISTLAGNERLSGRNVKRMEGCLALVFVYRLGIINDKLLMPLVNWVIVSLLLFG